ncbi:hypothetical protein CAL7716_056810 [Calothrix sp. PCC 7716]|nr:hypothetical protein CAL7716_056810 [Calothrix sp. PCC 7716]
MSYSNSDFTNCPEIPQVLPQIVRRESLPSPEGEEIFTLPRWNCFCCRDTGIVRYHLAKYAIRDYDPKRDANPICQRCGLGSRWMHLKGNIDMQISKDTCEKLDTWDRKNWEESLQDLLENNQVNKDFVDNTVAVIATSKSIRRRARTHEENQNAQYKHQLVSSDRYEAVQSEEE